MLFKKIRLKAQLFASYCISIFGCELGSPNESIHDLGFAWRKVGRRLWDLPKKAHCLLLLLLNDCLPLTKFADILPFNLWLHGTPLCFNKFFLLLMLCILRAPSPALVIIYYFACCMHHYKLSVDDIRRGHIDSTIMKF